MRDYLVLAIVVGSLPIILARPYVGILMWSWIGYMNPHRLSWSFVYEMPLAQMVGVATIIGLIFTRDRGKMPLNSTTVIWGLFIAWFSFTMIAAPISELGFELWDKAAKIQLFAILTVLLIRNKQQINALIWVIVLSLGFYGVKGGLFTVRTGGDNRVYGPPDSFLQDNNAMALALIMVLPLMWYITNQLAQRWQRYAMVAAMLATSVAILGSHSRGAALAGATIVFFLVVKSQSVIKFGLVMVLLLPVGLSVMPGSWFERMETIGSYEQDSSAMGRITAWKFATEMAIARPIGGGFDAFNERNYRKYSPDISEEIDLRDGRYQGAHSIYFRVLGEHGFPGLVLFLGLVVSAYRRASITKELAQSSNELSWAADLSRMLQVSIIGYAVGGAFLGLSYFDLYYHLIALIVIVNAYCISELEVDPLIRKADRLPPRLTN